MNVALIGYGEVGRIFAEDLRRADHAVTFLEPWSAFATAERQTWVADLADRQVFGDRGVSGFARSSDWRPLADRIRPRTAATRKG